MSVSENWWTTPTTSLDGRTVIVTGRDDVDKYRLSGKYTDRIEVTWTYEGQGMPPDDIIHLMEQADGLLREQLKNDKGVILTGIYTGDGQRNWVFYVKNTRIFQSLLNRAWASLPLLPVTISAEKDPEWAEYTEMRELTYITSSDN